MAKKTGNKLGTFGGVFTPSILTILGVIMFMRAGYVIGEAGIINTLFILMIAKSITALTGISISAVSTNTPVSGGGAYFLISRALGPEFGGAIGIALFTAQAISVPFYVLGFTEALVRAFPHTSSHFQSIALAATICLFIISYVGAKWAVKTQVLIMIILGASIVAFMGGALLKFSPEIFVSNLSPEYSSSDISFWVLFAIYFPAATGIMAGVNMSGDLENPSKSIPAGTFAAVATGFLIYAMQIFIVGGAQTRFQLINSSFETLGAQALFNLGFFITGGVFAATLSSGLGSFLGAPRVLQAVARDNVIPFLGLFRYGSKKGDEPHRALILTLLISFGVIFWAGNDTEGGAFNTIASMVTMFFLYTYGMINLAAFVESFAGNPSFRPRFRYYHWIPTLAGGMACAITALLIDTRAAVLAAVLIIVFYYLLRRRVLRVRFGDARWGFIYSRVRNNLMKLAKMSATPKNWRPSILVLTGDPEDYMTMIMFALWTGNERGIVTLGRVLTGDLIELAGRREVALEQLKRFVAQNDFAALSSVVVSSNVDEGLSALMQGHAVSPLNPNVVFMGWASNRDRFAPFARHLISIRSLKRSIVLIRDRGLPENAVSRRIDVWWRGKENGSMMLLFAHLLTLNYEWSNARIRLLRVIENEEGREPATMALEELIESARVNADPQVVVSNYPFKDVISSHSSDATLIFLGFNVPEEKEASSFQSGYEEMLEGLPTTLLFCSSGEEDLLA